MFRARYTKYQHPRRQDTVFDGIIKIEIVVVVVVIVVVVLIAVVVAVVRQVLSNTAMHWGNTCRQEERERTECCKTTRLSMPMDNRTLPFALKRARPAAVEWPMADTHCAPWFWQGYLSKRRNTGRNS